MKPTNRARRLLIATVLLAVAGCEVTEPVSAPAAFEGTWAGARWSGDAGAAWFPTPDTLTIGGSSPAGALMRLDWVDIRVAIDGPGTYPIAPGRASFRYLLGGDVVTASYAASGGSVIIQSVTDSTVRGRVVFDAVFTSGASAPVGETARFDAAFDALIHPQP